MKMKKYLMLFLLVQPFLCFAQNVKIEISDLLKKTNGREYGTFQFAHSSYSESRPTIVFITNRPVYLKSIDRIPKIFDGKKQEYTDVWVLGITGFDKDHISDSDNKIIEQFYAQITKYRADNELPPYSIESLKGLSIIISREDELCKYVRCFR